MTSPGYDAFVHALADLAAETAEPRLARLVHELRNPCRVLVRGRPGSGRRTVARALSGAGVPVVGAAAGADVDVYVVTETLKPEDADALTGCPRPCLVVLNKADLTGFGGGGPVATAADRCRRLQAGSGVPARPLAGLAAAISAAALDDLLLAALRGLAGTPASLAGVDAFLDTEHPLPRATRSRLLAELDLFGIAHAVTAIRRGADRSGVVAALRAASGLDAVVAAIDRAAAPVRYRRLLAAVSVLTRLSPGCGGDRIAEFLAADDTVLSRLAAAADVVADAGLPVDDAGGQDALLRRAVVWQRYAGGPVSGLHRCCGRDIARGTLRLWERAGGRAECPR